MSPFPVLDAPAEPACARGTRIQRPAGSPTNWLPAAVLALLVASNLPLFLCLPLTNDAVLYDLQAKQLLGGGTLYRDVFEPNLPGVVWVHAGIRTLFGWSSEALRAADLLFFTMTLVLLSAWVGGIRKSRRAGLWAAAVLLWFYFSISEWCHCQRDVWLLPFALCGLWLRWRQVARMRAAAALRPIAFWAMAEGMCWACGFWIKPHIALPAIACWLASAVVVRRTKPTCVDLAGILAGGMLVGAVGFAWMNQSGTWPYFLETFREWNPRYVRAGRENWTFARFVGMNIRLFPWLFVHAAALPVAIAWVFRACRFPRLAETESRKLFLAAVYLAWMAQAYSVQHLFDYVHAPTIVLAIGVLAGVEADSRTGRVWRASVIAFLVVAAVSSPTLRFARLASWSDCLAGGSSPGVRDRLTQLAAPNWEDLERVCDYLEGLGVRDGEVTAYNNSLIDVYPRLGFKPSTRYAYLESLIGFFPEKHDVFHEALDKSRQKYIVTDLVGSGMTSAEANETGPEGPMAPPPALARYLKTARFRGTFPWGQPVVYRSGSILVHRVTQPLGRFVNERAAR